jgi:hypothetical protein
MARCARFGKAIYPKLIGRIEIGHESSLKCARKRHFSEAQQIAQSGFSRCTPLDAREFIALLLSIPIKPSAYYRVNADKQGMYAARIVKDFL